MKTNKIPAISALTLAAFLTGSIASAQIAGAANTATSTTGTLNPPVVRTPPPTTAQTTTTTNVGAGGSVNAVGAPVINPMTNPVNPTTNPVATGTPNATDTTKTIDSSLAGSAAVQGDLRNRDLRANASANTSTAANPGITGLATGDELSSGLNATLNPAETIHDIRGASVGSRESLYTQVNGRLESSSRSISDIRKSGRELKGDARSQFNAAYDDLQTKEKALKRSLNESRKASNETWSTTQAQLASDYEAYATAVARTEAAANAHASTTTGASPAR